MAFTVMSFVKRRHKLPTYIYTVKPPNTTATPTVLLLRLSYISNTRQLPKTEQKLDR